MHVLRATVDCTTAMLGETAVLLIPGPMGETDVRLTWSNIVNHAARSPVEVKVVVVAVTAVTVCVVVMVTETVGMTSTVL